MKIADTSFQFQFILVKCQLPQISPLVSFKRYLTNTNQYNLETNITGKIG